MNVGYIEKEEKDSHEQKNDEITGAWTPALFDLIPPNHSHCLYAYVISTCSMTTFSTPFLHNTFSYIRRHL